MKEFESKEEEKYVLTSDRIKDEKAENAPTDLQVSQSMRKYGGSFASALGLAAQCADSENLSKIKNTWPDLWKKYSFMAQADRLRD